MENNDQDALFTEEEHQESKLSFVDKITGIFTEPTELFGSLAGKRQKHSDWVLPVLIYAILSIIFLAVILNAPSLKNEMMEKQLGQTEKALQEQVEKENLTQEQADKRLEMTYRAFNKGNLLMIRYGVSIIIFTFLVVLIASGFFFLIFRPILKGIGRFPDALVAYGMPYYILAINVIISLILSLASNSLMETNVADLAGIEKSAFGGFILSKINPFYIWFFWAVGIAYGKLFKMKNASQGVIIVIGSWLITSVLFYWLGTSIPFFKGLVMR